MYPTPGRAQLRRFDAGLLGYGRRCESPGGRRPRFRQAFDPVAAEPTAILAVELEAPLQPREQRRSVC